jgi:pumilio homology domain family member 6
MLHDAMLQYYLNLKPESEEWSEFFEFLKGDEEGDLLKNLAFTKSGSRIVCHTLAYSDAKGRRQLLKMYKDTMELLAYDAHGHAVLLTAYDVIDDTKMAAKAIFPELLGPDANAEAQQDKILALASHLTGRIALLYLLAGPAKWLMPDADNALLADIHAIRASTSKKDPETRHSELVGYFAAPVLAAVAARARDFAASSFGCYFVVEALLGAPARADRAAALRAVADVAAGDPVAEGHVAQEAACGRMLKRLVEGGRFDPSTREVVLVGGAPLGFADVLYERIREYIVQWAMGPSSFVVVGLLESAEFGKKDEVLEVLRENKRVLKKAAGEEQVKAVAEKKKKKTKKYKGSGDKGGRGNTGARLLLEKLD